MAKLYVRTPDFKLLNDNRTWFYWIDLVTGDAVLMYVSASTAKFWNTPIMTESEKSHIYQLHNQAAASGRLFCKSMMHPEVSEVWKIRDKIPGSVTEWNPMSAPLSNLR